jgi:hypothetical protein
MATHPPTKRVELLKDRNDKLAATVAVQRSEIARLQADADGAATRERGYQGTLLAVNRLWEELNGTIAFLDFR